MPRSLIVGSPEHKELFCKFFLETHVAFDPATVDWPELDEDSFKRLHSLPVWDEAIETECRATCTIQTWVPFETDPLIREAIALQGYEEALGPKHTSTLDTVDNLGILYKTQGKLAEAEAMYIRAL